MDKLAKILYKFRYLWFSLITAITILLIFFIKIEPDNSLKTWFSEDDPHYIAYQKYRDAFDGSSYLIIALRSENIFSMDNLYFLEQKTEELEDLEKVTSVHSLANANKIIGTSEGIEIHPLLADLKPDNLNKIQKYSLEDELFKGYLVSPDGMFTTIVVNFEEMTSEEADWCVEQIEEIVNDGKPRNIEVFFSGDQKSLSEFNRLTNQNIRIGPFIVIPLVSLCIFWLFRSFYKNLIILFIMGTSICWALGFYTLLGFPTNVLTVMLVPIVTVLSIADSVHIMMYFEEVKDNSSKKMAFIRTVKYIAIPCFVTSITTAFGLFSLSVSRVGAVKYFGIGSAAGIMFAFIISIVSVPFMLSFLNTHQKCKYPLKWDTLLNGISTFNKRRYRYIIILFVLGFIIACWGVAKVRIESNRLEWFSKKGDFYKSAKIVDSHLFGTDDMEIVIQGKVDDLKNPNILKRIDLLSLRIEELPRVKKVISISNYVKRIHKALHEDKPEFFKVPDNQFLIAQELFLFSLSDDGRKEIESYITSDYSQGRISIKIESMPSAESLILGNRLENMVKETFYGTDLQVNLTGTIYLHNLSDQYIFESQIKGFILAFILIIGVLFLAFFSVKFGILSIFPNLIPIVFIFGIMGWFGVPLNVGTVMIASVALGIAVDDTVHFISRFRKEYTAENISLEHALNKTTVSVGKPIVFTSMINIIGFSTALLSGFLPTREFGLLISLTLLFALLGDIIFLPANILALKKIFKARV